MMSTRGTRLSPDHVNALNMIDMCFSEKNKKERAILRAWRKLLDQYLKYPKLEDFDDDNRYMIALQAATGKAEDYFIDLLSEMSSVLGYEFETIHLRNGCYVPMGHAEVEQEQRLLRKALIELAAGRLPLSMNVTSLPEQKSKIVPFEKSPEVEKAEEG